MSQIEITHDVEEAMDLAKEYGMELVTSKVDTDKFSQKVNELKKLATELGIPFAFISTVAVKKDKTHNHQGPCAGINLTSTSFNEIEEINQRVDVVTKLLMCAIKDRELAEELMDLVGERVTARNAEEMLEAALGDVFPGFRPKTDA